MREQLTQAQIIQTEINKRRCRIAIKKQLYPLEVEIKNLKNEINKQKFANSLEKIPNKILNQLNKIKSKLKKLTGMEYEDPWDSKHEDIQKRIAKLRKEIKEIEKKLAEFQNPEFIAVDKQELELQDLSANDRVQYKKKTKYEKDKLKKQIELDLLTGEDNAAKLQMEMLEKQMLASLNSLLNSIMTPLNGVMKLFPAVKIEGASDLVDLLQLIPDLESQLAQAESEIDNMKNQSSSTLFGKISDACTLPKLSPQFEKKLEDISDAIAGISTQLPLVMVNLLIYIVYYILTAIKIPSPIGLTLMDIAAGEPHIAQILTLLTIVPKIPQLVMQLHPCVKKMIKRKMQSIQRLGSIANFCSSPTAMDELDKLKFSGSMECCPEKEKANVAQQCEQKKQTIEDLKKQLNDLKEDYKKIIEY